MSEIADPDEMPRARSLRSRWPGLVWAIPLSALILVAILGVHAFLNRGIRIVVSFDTVLGVKVGDTKIVYQGYEAGEVTNVDFNRKTRRIDVTLSIDRRAEPVLNTGTIFWLVGVKPNLTDVSSVKSAIAGPTIGIAPSYEGTPTRHFRGLIEEPVVLPGTHGTPYRLTAERIGSIKPRATVTYHGQEIGKVVATALASPESFDVRIFVYRPYDRLVRPGAIFWPAAPLQLSLGSGTVQAKAINPSALLSGGIEMEVPADAAPVRSPPNARFLLYGSRAAAETGPPGVRVPYAMTFSGAGGGLLPGAPVTLMGFEIGRVTSRALVMDGPGGLPATRVTIGLEPARLGAGGGDRPRVASDAAVGRLLARGYRAKLVQQPPLVGSYGIALVRGGDGRAALLPGDPPRIPALGGGVDPGEQLQSILGKIDRIPIERIGRDLAATTARVRSLVSSPRIDDSLTHLDRSLARVDQMTAEVKPQIGPLVAKLREAATQASAAAGAARTLLAGDGADPDASLPGAIRELGDAAESIRALADYLGRHPEALVKGKGSGRSKVKKAKK